MILQPPLPGPAHKGGNTRALRAAFSIERSKAFSTVLSPLGGPEVGASGPGISVDLGFARSKGPLREGLQNPPTSWLVERASGGLFQTGRKSAKGLFGETVLQRVVGQDDDPPSRNHPLTGRLQRRRNHVQFVVDRNPKGLESPGGRMSVTGPETGRNGGSHDVGQLRRRLDGPPTPGCDHVPGDLFGEPLLAEGLEDPLQFSGGELIDQRRGGGLLVAVHAHIERTRMRPAETAACLVHLGGGHPKVKQCPPNALSTLR